MIFSGPRVRIGRSRDNDVILPERDSPLSSAHHAEVLLDSTGVWSLVDLNSSNGTTINDVAIGRHAVKSGDRVTFGDQQFLVTIEPDAPHRSRAWMIALTTMIALVVAGAVLSRNWRQPPFEDVAASASASVFMIAVEENGVRSTIGTAFAIGADGLLATNAHIVGALRKRGALAGGGRPGVRAVAVLGDAYTVRVIRTATTHPAWREGSIQGDVALLRLEGGPMLVPLRLADARTIAALRRGMPLAAFGFPAVSTDPARPRGRLSVDVLGDVRGSYFEVGLGIAPGTSGSPVFDAAGAVVAIVAGGDFVDAPEGARPTGSSANWALSAATVAEVPAPAR